MELKIALIIAVIVQFIAFIVAISLIPKTKFSIAWVSISVGFFLMAIRRLVEVFYFFQEIPTDKATLVNSWIAVIISLSMLLSSFYIRKIFEVLNRIHQLRKESEAKLLSAIISTEEKERKHFAKELHDGLGPVLSSAKMTISVIDRINIQEKAAGLLDKVEKLVDNAILTTKEISNHLTPHVLGRYGLKKAVEAFIHSAMISDSIQIKLFANIDKKRYKGSIEVVLYRICCELINNTQRHAFASKITISLIDDNKNIKFKYEDNGVGFDSLNEEYGMGLTNIVSRVKALHGTIELISAPRKGYNAHIALPL